MGFTFLQGFSIFPRWEFLVDHFRSQVLQGL
ncbi:hypothetical protein PBI_SHEPARD_36 [Arthrobacter phage Shepard]|nr:hypothetical protein PBI_SHEPARD_36 [Arthrobacter phage Shepard]